MTTAAKTTSKLLVTLKDPTGRKRANARHQLMLTAGAAVAGAMIAGVVGVLERRRRHARADQHAAEPAVRTAGISTADGYRSRHGAGAPGSSSTSARPAPARGPAPIDKLAASAERLQTWGADEPGFRAHLGFGVGGSIPVDAGERMGESMPTAGGDAFDGTVRGGRPGDFAHEIVTGAGEAIGNSTTRPPNGNGASSH